MCTLTMRHSCAESVLSTSADAFSINYSNLRIGVSSHAHRAKEATV